MTDAKFHYCLRSSECPDIVLTHGDTLTLGRGPLTKISDTRVSRHHTTVILLQDGGGVKIKVCQLGLNHSVIDNKPVYRGDTVLLSLGEVFHFKATN